MKLSISNGAAYADLDNDGDLDIITNNINSGAFIMQNEVEPKDAKENKVNYLTVTLSGSPLNKDGIGAKVFAYSKGLTQMLEQYPVRGYLSTVDSRLHFGFASNSIDSLKIVWQDQKTQVVTHPAANTILRVDYANATTANKEQGLLPSPFLSDITNQENIDFHHRETFFLDYAFQPLIQQKYSQEGPFISTGDMNGDGREDFFIGGAFQQAGKVFLQQADGTFSGKDLTTGTKNEEDMQSILFDADGDGDLICWWSAVVLSLIQLHPIIARVYTPMMAEEIFN